jgi:outer membrane receptor for monomeric catechols
LLANNATFALVNNFTRYRANVYATYSFFNDRLRGVTVGGGVNVVGPAKVGSAATPFEYLYSNSYYLVSAHVSYTRNIGKTQWRFQANISNALDQDDPIITNYTNYKVQGVTANPDGFVPNGFRINDPRQLIFSTTVRF